MLCLVFIYVGDIILIIMLMVQVTTVVQNVTIRFYIYIQLQVYCTEMPMYVLYNAATHPFDPR